MHVALSVTTVSVETCIAVCTLTILTATGEQRQARAALEQEASELKGHITQLNTRLEAAQAQQGVAEAAQEEVIILLILQLLILLPSISTISSIAVATAFANHTRTSN
jgi:hypothetical protein